MATKVIYRKDEYGDILAVFPEEPWNRHGDFTCYAHIGQHGACNLDYVKQDTTPATTEEAAELHSELISQGYTDLEVIEL